MTDIRPIHMKAALFGDSASIDRVYGPARLEQLQHATELCPFVVTRENLEEKLPEIEDLEVIFSTWGMFSLTEEQLDRLPGLRAIFYAAGSVRSFAEPMLRRGITVMSGWGANAVPVAEFTFAQIVLGNKGYFRNSRGFRGPEDFHGAFRGRGNFGATVALLGAGQIGQRVIELLRPHRIKTVVFDPFLSEEAAAALGVEKTSLSDAFARGQVVSNHLANLPETRGMLTGPLFESLPRDAVFINTGRGATVDEADLIRVLEARPDVTALLDVTEPEPPEAGSKLYSLPNVQLSTHIAGAIGDEVGRLAEVALEEFEAWERGEPLRYRVTLEMLPTMA